MSGIRKKYPSKLKAKVVIEAWKEDKTLEEVGSLFEVPHERVKKWRKLAKDNLHTLFESKRDTETKEREELIDRLYQQIGQLQTEYDWLKKKIGKL